MFYIFYFKVLHMTRARHENSVSWFLTLRHMYSHVCLGVHLVHADSISCYASYLYFLMFKFSEKKTILSAYSNFKNIFFLCRIVIFVSALKDTLVLPINHSSSLTPKCVDTFISCLESLRIFVVLNIKIRNYRIKQSQVD